MAVHGSGTVDLDVEYNRPLWLGVLVVVVFALFASRETQKGCQSSAWLLLGSAQPTSGMGIGEGTVERTAGKQVGECSVDVHVLLYV